MVDEQPKDYSSVYCEEKIRSDGLRSYKRKSESTVDLLAVVAKLQNLPQKNHSVYAMDTLNRHYSSVFANRKKNSLSTANFYKVYIKYHEDRETFVFRVERNILEDIVGRMPKKGNYRLFFKQTDNTCEEIDSYDAKIPFHEREGDKYIYCTAFPDDHKSKVY